jgi:hypothetical protein
MSGVLKRASLLKYEYKKFYGTGPTGIKSPTHVLFVQHGALTLFLTTF